MQTTGNRFIDILRLRWRSLSRRGTVEAELDDELRFHLETLIDKYTSEGATTAEATRRAHLELGMPEAIKDHVRDTRGLSPLENLAKDIAYAVRTMKKSPGFVLTAAAAIALGIGANTALFSLVYSLMYRALPVADPGTFRNVHLTTFGEGSRSGYGTMYNVSWQEFNYIRNASKTADIAGLAEVEMSRKDDARPVRTQLASDNLLSLIGSKPVLGRFFTPDEVSRPGSMPVTVLTHRVWQHWFGGSPDVIGKTIVLNRQPFTIIGVADEKTTGPVIMVPDLWIPLTMQPVTRPGEPLIDSPTNGWVQLFARRRPGHDDSALRAEMQLLGQQAIQPHLPKRKAQVAVESGAYFNFPFVKRQFKPIFAILTLAVGLVLIVACANVANMLLARGLSRRREIAIRLSIGAGRKRILQQLLTESVMLALAGGAAGLFIAWTGARLLLTMLPGEAVGNHQVDPSPDGTVLLFTVGISIATGIIFGLLPALNTLRFDLTPALRTEGLEEHGRSGRKRLQNVLIGIQVAVCLVLLVNAGLLLRGFTRALTMDPGQTTANVLITSVDLRQQQYDADRGARFMNTLRETVSTSPGVLAASTTMVEPLHDQCGSFVRLLEGDKVARELRTSCNEVGPEYFKTAGIRLLNGREFTPAEMFNTARVAIIDERFARDAFGVPANAIGSTIRLGDRADADHQIIGVASVVTPLDLNGFNLPKVYTTMRGLRNTEAKLLVSYAGNSSDVEQAIRAAVARLDAGVTPRTKRIEESIQNALLPARMAAAAATALGSLALILACTGVYGLVSFAISRRRKEVGIRMALGADRATVLRLVMWQGLKPVFVGSLVGLALAAAASQAIRAMLFGVSPLDPIAFASTAALLIVIAGLAALVPARNAMAVDPATTLRHD